MFVAIVFTKFIVSVPDNPRKEGIRSPEETGAPKEQVADFREESNRSWWKWGVVGSRLPVMVYNNNKRSLFMCINSLCVLARVKISRSALMGPRRHY